MLPERPTEEPVRRITVIVAAGLLGACSNSVDTSPNCLPGFNCGDIAAQGDAAKDDVPKADVPSNDETAGAQCDCLEPGAWYRFTTLTVTSLDGDPKHPAINALNPVWVMDIEKHELNIMFKLDTVTPTELTLTALDSARIGKEGEYCSLPLSAAPVEHVRSGCSMAPSKPTFINVYAGDQTHPKNCSPKAALHAIPVDNVVIEGTHTGTCGAPETDFFTGHIKGVVPKSVLDNTCTCLLMGPEQYSEECGELTPGYLDPDPNNPGACNDCGPQWHSLLGLLKALGGGKELKADCKTIKGEPAICIEADYVSSRVLAAPKECGK